MNPTTSSGGHRLPIHGAQPVMVEGKIVAGAERAPVNAGAYAKSTKDLRRPVAEVNEAQLVFPK